MHFYNTYTYLLFFPWLFSQLLRLLFLSETNNTKFLLSEPNSSKYNTDPCSCFTLNPFRKNSQKTFDFRPSPPSLGEGPHELQESEPQLTAKSDLSLLCLNRSRMVSFFLLALDTTLTVSISKDTLLLSLWIYLHWLASSSTSGGFRILPSLFLLRNSSYWLCSKFFFWKGQIVKYTRLITSTFLLLA